MSPVTIVFVLVRRVTRASRADSSSSLAMLMCQRCRHSGNWLNRWKRKSEANTRNELFQVQTTIYAALAQNKQIIM